MAETIKDKVVIVTGGGSGMGRAIALALAALGAKVVVCGRRPEPLEETAQMIRAAGAESLALKADVSIPEDAARVVENVVQTWGPVDMLVNAAGVPGRGKMHEHDLQAWERSLNVNLKGPFLMSKAVLPIMREQKHGEIVMISSELSLGHYPGSGSYAVAKHALNDLSEIIQQENQAFGIRVHVICPSWTWTDMINQMRQLDPDKCLQPEDIADLVVYLVTRRPGVKISRPILIQPMENPWVSK
jgi:NAD(P)-dependent dehydrogenase (short-subunit alcohol dehydrogenase family)